jgi:hypothetical protein
MQPVLYSQRYRSHRVLRQIVGQLYFGVIETPLQLRPHIWLIRIEVGVRGITGGCKIEICMPRFWGFDGEVHVHLGHEDGLKWACPECGEPGPLYDHQPERCWRHLDTCQYRTILHAEPPRSNCRGGAIEPLPGDVGRIGGPRRCGYAGGRHQSVRVCGGFRTADADRECHSEPGGRVACR